MGDSNSIQRSTPLFQAKLSTTNKTFESGVGSVRHWYVIEPVWGHPTPLHEASLWRGQHPVQPLFKWKFGQGRISW
jgi:hypothetical protein